MTEPPHPSPKPSRPRTSRNRFDEFVDDYKHRRLDDKLEEHTLGATDKPPAGARASTPAPAKGLLAAKLTPKRRESLREYIRWLKPHRNAVIWFTVLALIVAGLQMIEPLFMRYIVDNVLLVSGVDTATRISRLNLAGAVFLIAIISQNLLNAFKDFRQRKLNVKVMLSLRRSLFDRLLNLPLPKLWEMKTGGILSRLTGDVDTTTGLLQLAIVSPALSLIRLLIAISVLTALNWRLALTALAIIPGIMLISFISAKRIRPIYRSIRKDVEQIDGRVGETFSGIRVVRAFRREIYELLEYMRGRHTVLRKEMFAQRREMIIWTSWGLLMGAVNVVIVWYGGYLNIQKAATVGDIMAFQWYTFLLLNPVWNIVNSFSELQRSLAAMERVFEILALPADKPDRPGAMNAPSHVDAITFENVAFEYREGRPVVKDFSVTVPSGSVVALVGRSGAGKTTITDIVARFHNPTSGRVLLNGVDIRDYRLGTYRDLLAIVQQSVFLFDGTIRENIAYGRQDATDPDVEEAARLANAHEFIEKLPEGYETIVGERGVKLSGGQQQRLAIARAIVKKPAILILDEATSNLDTESEQLIQASMAGLLAGRTTFVIAHRLSTVHRADLILLMADGAIVERGTHEELMAARGVYHEMVQRQMESHGEQGESVLSA
ncbi:MAG: ABC transporter ATP-binding protein [Gemmatimonadetes bacterium]|nr:ABC transporter ATP-binding protein [Gemmatimonadota bacterium]